MMDIDAHSIAQIHFIHQPREFIQKEWTPLVVSYTMRICFDNQEKICKFANQMERNERQ